MNKMPFNKYGYSTVPKRMVLGNNGFTARLTIPGSGHNIRIFKPELNRSYIFSELHFHWGSDSSQGSEHRLDGLSFPLEGHFVHYSELYDSIKVAKSKPVGGGDVNRWFLIGYLPRTA